VRVLEFGSESGFDFDVVVDRGFDVGRCSQGGRSLAWISPTGFPGPWFADPEGLGFLRGFGAGLLTTCGLDHAFARPRMHAWREHVRRRDRTIHEPPRRQDRRPSAES
jgi:hypothetical protein